MVGNKELAAAGGGRGPGGGSALFALAIGVAGVYRSMVVVGSMPLMAQGIAWAAGSERPSALEVAGAVLVTAGVAMAFA
ncbi:hypothetical protein [Acidilobus sp. 7A]|uniref:hypothetical protein n=1 Tax=Acidilobus sp. 7A TaxID=1577685 RepID=UPI000764D541|nr:hypothetical protein [Acidilobus sp. 7A]AMD30706.1 hypothetical protein SE86_04605 [Acidilobus sp. 7A]